MKLRFDIHSIIRSTAFCTALAATGVGCTMGTEYAPEAASEPGSSADVPASGAGEVSPEQAKSGIALGATETELTANPIENAESGIQPNRVSTAASLSNDEPARSEGSEEPEDAEATVAAPPIARPTMETSGRQLLDSCGNPFVVRGVEQIFGEQLPEGNDWLGLVEDIAASGVNAVRILAGTDTLSTADVDALIGHVGARNMVAYVTPYGSEATEWLGHADVREMLARHEKYIIIDAFGEPTFDDRARFVRDSTDTIRRVRDWGYRVPLTVTANQFGRDLPSLLQLGAEITAADPLDNTILGWQAYWGQGGYYQRTYGMNLAEAAAAAASAPFPIQFGLDRVTDFPSEETADFGALMAAAETHGIGWLWWDWYNPYGNENNLTADGSHTRLTPTGQIVVNTHAASVQNTAVRTCGGAPPS